jgi:hypothetical protein
VLTLKELNRATLARQFLIERQRLDPLAAVAHLAGLQAQDSTGPYLSLWARLSGFQREELTAQVEQRRMLIGSLQRLTIHMVTAEDYPWLRATLAPMLRRRSRAHTALSGVDVDRLQAAAVERLPARMPELRRLAGAEDPNHVAMFLQAWLPLVRVPPAGTWGVGGSPLQELGPLGTPDTSRLVGRYLAAFGPASVGDAQAWSGMTRLGDAFASLPLAEFEGPDGTLLYDLADAPRPPADTKVPVRFLPRFDSVLLGHADRRRIIPADRPTAGIVGVNTVLVDGCVAGSWTWDGTDVTVIPFQRLPVRAVEAERRRLRDWLRG